MKQKITLLTRLMLLLCALIVGSGSVWAEDPELTLDFTSAWTAGDDNSDEEKVFTTTVGETTYTISGNGGTNFKFNSGYFIFGKSDAYVNLPIVDFDVKKIEVVGRSGASGDVRHNIFVEDTPVSTEVKGLNGTTSTFDIASGYQAAGTQYILRVTSNHNAQVTYIKYYKKTSGGDEPTTYTITFDSGDGTFVGNTDFPNESNTKEAGTYTLPSATKDGYTFNGWLMTGGTEPITGSYIVSDDVDFTADYTQNSGGSTATTHTYNFAGADNFYTDAELTTHPSSGSSNSVSTIYYEDGSIFVASGTNRYFSSASSGYFMLGKSGAKISLPTFEGYKITQVKMHSSTGHSTSVSVSIVSGDNTASAAQTWSTKDNDYVYDIASDYQSSPLSVLVTNGYNTQFTSITIVCEEDVPSTDPAISAEATLGLAYDATSGEIAYSIVNPVDGTTLTAASEAEWISDITVSEDKVTFTTTANEGAERTATITLTYGTLTKDVTVTQAAAPVIYTTIPDLFAAATSTATDVNVTFNNWVVSGVSTNGKNVFVTDGTNGFVINSSTDQSSTYTVGDILSGTAVSCSLKLNSGYAQITNLNATDLTITAGGTVSAANIAMADLTGVNTGVLVSYESLTCSLDNNKYYLSDGTTTIQLYNSLYSYGTTFEAGKTYNITGIYQQYNNTKEILPRSADDIEEVVILVPSITLSTNTIEAPAEGTDGTITVTYENITEVYAEVYFCDAEGAAATYDWIDAEINDENNLYYIISDNTGDARTAYMKVYALDDEGQDVYSELITITQAAYVAPVEPVNGYFEKVTSTDDITNGQYLIVYEGGAVAFDGSLETLDAASNTIGVIFETDGTIKATTENIAAVFNIDVTNGTLMSASGFYIGVSSNSNGLKTSTDATKYTNSFSIDDNENAVISAVFDGSVMTLRYNYASDNLRFRYYKNYGQQPIQLYKFIPGTVDVTSFGWATYIAEDNVSFGNDVSAYIATDNSDTSVTLTEVSAVAKGTPVVVCAEEGTHKLGAIDAADCADVTSNLLVVCDGLDAASGFNYFVLAKDGESACFKQWTGLASALDGRVVLPLQLDLSQQGGTRALKINFGGEATGITNVNVNHNDNYYNLNGQRVSQPKKGGLYIVNGKKALVK